MPLTITWKDSSLIVNFDHNQATNQLCTAIYASDEVMHLVGHNENPGYDFDELSPFVHDVGGEIGNCYIFGVGADLIQDTPLYEGGNMDSVGVMISLIILHPEIDINIDWHPAYSSGSPNLVLIDNTMYYCGAPGQVRLHEAFSIVNDLERALNLPVTEFNVR